MTSRGSCYSGRGRPIRYRNRRGYVSRGYGCSGCCWTRTDSRERACVRDWTSNSGHFNGHVRCAGGNQRSYCSSTRWTTERRKVSDFVRRSSRHRRSYSSRWHKATSGTGSLTFWRKGFLTFSRGGLRKYLPLGVCNTDETFNSWRCGSTTAAFFRRSASFRSSRNWTGS